MTEPASAPQAPAQAELRAERLAEEEALRPSRRLALAAVGVWLGLFALLAGLLPEVALRSPHGRKLVPTLPLDPATVTVCAVFVCAVATARAPGGPGTAARDFVRLAFAFGLWTAASTVVQLVAAFVLGGPTAPGDAATGVLLVLLSISVLGTLVGGGGLALLWLCVAHEVAVLPRGERREEVARVAHLSAPFLAGVVLWTAHRASSLASSPLVLVPAPLAVALTLSGVVVVLAAWLRLRRPAAYGRGPVE